MTTTTKITHHGITAEAAVWSDTGLAHRDGSLRSDAPYGYERDLLAAREEAGADDWRALARYVIRRERAGADKTRSTAMARQADAMAALAHALETLPVSEAVTAIRHLAEAMTHT